MLGNRFRIRVTGGMTHHSYFRAGHCNSRRGMELGGGILRNRSLCPEILWISALILFLSAPSFAWGDAGAHTIRKCGGRWDARIAFGSVVESALTKRVVYHFYVTFFKIIEEILAFF